jgi:manganese-dependent inorganic pyrophosphatase
MISTAHTKYRKITETIDGKMFCGNLEDYCTDGKMLIAAADEDYMSSQIEKGDLVVLGNREKLQLRAITEGAGTIVVCTGSKISQSVIDTANEYHCNVIGSKYDTFRVVRLIGQSMPVSYFMKRDNLVTFQMDDLTESMRQVMSQKRYKYFPVIDRKGHYVGMVSKRNLIDEGKRGVILVDHNEKTQAVDGIEAAEIVEIIDHHKIGNIQTILPVYFRNQPVGCTATIIFQRFLEEKIEIPQNIAGLLLSAILSDTLMFRSPTCTFIDEAAAKELAKIAQVEIEELATAMFMAGSNFDSKSCEEIFYMDFKKFNINGQTFGIGQVNVLTKEDERKVKERMIEYLEETHEKHGLDMVFFALTNIMEESSDMLYAGDRARACMQEAYDTEPGENSIYLPGVVSRKKQIIPALMSALQG